MRRCNRVDITCKVKIDFISRNNLRFAAAGSPPLHPQARPERRLAKRGYRLDSRRIQRLGQPDGC
ncbi:hypothetical protein D3C80_1815140 [compost metagenome]